MNTSLVTLAVLIALGLAVGCGSGEDQNVTGRDGGSAPVASIETPPGPCGKLGFAVDRVERFGEAIAGADEPALRRLLAGRFEWFSVNGWPTTADAFVAYGPAKAISFVKREDGIGTELRELAVSPPREGNYVDVSYSGDVSEPRHAGYGVRDVLVGKGAVNCDGTIRVWSMAIKDARTEAFEACSGRSGRRIDGLVVCGMN